MQNQKVPVEISARHIHLSKEDLGKLFGKDHNLTKYRELSQPGTFAAKEMVTLVGPVNRSLENIRVLGPCRDYSQIELSRTDAIYLGINTPLRLSGDIKGSASVIVKGPHGEVLFKEGVIVAKRHIHVSPVEADNLGINNGDRISIKIQSTPRPLVFNDVEVRVDPNFRLALHLDTDEGNAAWVEYGTEGAII